MTVVLLLSMTNSLSGPKFSAVFVELSMSISMLSIGQRGSEEMKDWSLKEFNHSTFYTSRMLVSLASDITEELGPQVMFREFVPVVGSVRLKIWLLSLVTRSEKVVSPNVH